MVQKALEHQCEIQEILTAFADSAFLPEPVDAHVFSLVKEFLGEYSLLANEADRRGDLLFSVVPKHHYYWHLGRRALYMNPRRGNCMIDEDYVGTIKTVVHSAVHGTEAHLVPSRVMEKVLWGKYLLMEYGI